MLDAPAQQQHDHDDDQDDQQQIHEPMVPHVVGSETMERMRNGPVKTQGCKRRHSQPTERRDPIRYGSGLLCSFHADSLSWRIFLDEMFWVDPDSERE